MLARRRGGGKTRKRTGGSRVKRSPNIVKETTVTINGKPAVVRIYKKGWKYDNHFVATVHMGATQMYYKSPRLGKKKKKPRRR